MLRPLASASATASFPAACGVKTVVTTSADSGPIEIAGCAVNRPASLSPMARARSTESNRIGMLLKFSMRRSTDQRPSARTVSCWMSAEGSDTRRTGPLEHEASSATSDATPAMTANPRVQTPGFMPLLRGNGMASIQRAKKLKPATPVAGFRRETGGWSGSHGCTGRRLWAVDPQRAGCRCRESSTGNELRWIKVGLHRRLQVVRALLEDEACVDQPEVQCVLHITAQTGRDRGGIRDRDAG